ncbi:MAG: Mu transposase C-terminal domain-containing protein, partial [Candidatus Omnitrophica bacterium]|nr:Mu transposase C-terminal domain-containing protein [Candidatus Omnitrophota bacterium]
IVDRENIYQSGVLRDACRQLRINIQPARPKKGSDKPWIERFFGTMNTRLLQKLPGYAGSSVANRGIDIEGKATLSIPDLEAAIGEWIVGDYHEYPHGGLRYEHDLSKKVSPNEAFRIGLETAGFLHVPRDPYLRLKLLPTEWRRFREEGVKFKNLIYDGKNLPRRLRETDGNYGPRWPIKYDPRDLRWIWFLDEETGEWIEIPWRYLRSVTKPFNHVALDLAKKKVKEGRGREPTEQEIEERLWDIMDDIERDIVEPSKDRKLARTRMRLKATRDRKPAPEKATQPDPPPDDIEWPLDAPSLSRRRGRQ